MCVLQHLLHGEQRAAQDKAVNVLRRSSGEAKVRRGRFEEGEGGGGKL